MKKVKFDFSNSFGKEVVLVGDFNNWNFQQGFVKNDSREWEIELEEGIYQYKFLIDGKFWVNDPQADLYLNNGKGALDSVVRVSDDSRRIKTNKNYGRITNITLNNSFDKEILTGEKKVKEKNQFNLRDNQIYVYNNLKNCIGEVELSYVWCTPDFRIYGCDSILVQGNKVEERLYHYINLTDEGLKPGKWKVFILINGKIIAKKEFILKANFYYRKGNQICIK